MSRLDFHCAAGVGEAEVADLHEVGGQDVLEESTDELHAIQGCDCVRWPERSRWDGDGFSSTDAGVAMCASEEERSGPFDKLRTSLCALSSMEMDHQSLAIDIRDLDKKRLMGTEPTAVDRGQIHTVMEGVHSRSPP